MKQAEIKFKTATNEELYFLLIAKKEEEDEVSNILITSETYKSKQGADKGKRAVVRCGQDRKNYKLKKAKDKRNYFVLQALNGEPIGTSEMYDKLQEARDDITLCIESCVEIAVAQLIN